MYVCALTIIGYVWSHGRKGRYIKTNVTGIRRRRKGLPRSTKMAPQGRPMKRKLGNQHIPTKPKKRKLQHCLSLKVKQA